MVFFQKFGCGEKMFLHPFQRGMTGVTANCWRNTLLTTVTKTYNRILLNRQIEATHWSKA